MAGPSYIHVIDSTSIVSDVFSNSVTPGAGVTEYYETHPPFVPDWNQVEWERTGANTYVNNGVIVQLPDEDATVAISDTDATQEFLETKLLSGLGISFTKISDSLGSEALVSDLDIISLDEDTDPSSENDFVVTYDYSSGTYKKVKLDTLLGLPRARTWAFNGGMYNVGTNETRDASWGRADAVAGIDVLRSGELLGLSIHISFPRTVGKLECFLVVNTIAQNASGQFCTIDATNTSHIRVVLATPIPISAGDVISVRTITTGFTPSGADATVALWGRDT
jgi:hypothetical protein